MFPKVSGVNLYGFSPLKGTQSQVKVEPQYIQSSVAPKYSLNFPRANDSDGICGVSPLANRLDIIS